MFTLLSQVRAVRCASLDLMFICGTAVTSNGFPCSTWEVTLGSVLQVTDSTGFTNRNMTGPAMLRLPLHCTLVQSCGAGYVGLRNVKGRPATRMPKSQAPVPRIELGPPQMETLPCKNRGLAVTNTVAGWDKARNQTLIK